MWRLWIIPMLLWEGVLGVLEGIRPPDAPPAKERERERRPVVRIARDSLGSYIDGECEVLE